MLTSIDRPVYSRTGEVSYIRFREEDEPVDDTTAGAQDENQEDEHQEDENQERGDADDDVVMDME